jgi:hypothetical protein
VPQASRQLSEWIVPLTIKKVDPGPADVVKFTAWASIVTTKEGVPIVDHDGEVILVEDLEKAVHSAALEGSGAGRGGLMHEYESKIDLLESMVVSREKRAALGFGDGPEGWVVTCQSRDPEVVKAIRGGDMRELSIRGEAWKEWVA